MNDCSSCILICSIFSGLYKLLGNICSRCMGIIVECIRGKFGEWAWKYMLIVHSEHRNICSISTGSMGILAQCAQGIFASVPWEFWSNVLEETSVNGHGIFFIKFHREHGNIYSIFGEHGEICSMSTGNICLSFMGIFAQGAWKF
jgi:hypothetical protein